MPTYNYTSPGSTSFTPNPGETTAIFRCTGGGGGGGKGLDDNSSGGGGGGGGYGDYTKTDCTSSDTFTVVVGAAGNGATSTGDGVSGGDSYVQLSTSLLAKGSGGTGGGVGASGGSGGSSNTGSSTQQGGIGGGGSSGDDIGGGGGGGAASSTSSGGSGNSPSGGSGGSGGSPGGGNGGSWTQSGDSASGTGGGGGGCGDNGTQAGTGGNGFVAIETTYAVPTLSSVNTPDVPTSGGTTIVLTGTNFYSGYTVKISASDCTDISYDSTSQITCKTPALSAGTYDITVTNPNSDTATLSSSITFHKPQVDSITPVSGSTAGGDSVTISGDWFTGATGATVKGVALASFSVADDETITGTTQAGAAGIGNVVVTNAGDTGTLSNGWEYTSAGGGAAANTLTLLGVG